jgi:DNA repair exonuclease SbcCD nuclease subunit
MNLLLTGDWHISDRRPKRRLDKDYFQTQVGKLDQIRDIYKERKCDAVLQTGDVYDIFRASNGVVSDLMLYLRKEWDGIPIYTIYGQHDIAGHSESTFVNSPLRLLESAGVMTVMRKNAAAFISPITEGVALAGCPFGEKVHAIRESGHNRYNILIMHENICSEPLWPGHEPIHPKTFLRNNPNYDLIVCGDYHYRSLYRQDDRWIINPGCLMRKTFSGKDLEHEPAVVIFDTYTKTAEVIKLDIQPAEQIFDLTIEEKAAEPDYVALREFLNRMERAGSVDVGWREILLKLYFEKKTSANVKELISISIEEANEQLAKA